MDTPAAFLAPLLTLFNPNSTDPCRVLSNFQKGINKSLIDRVPEPERPNYIDTIWKALLSAASNSISNVRMASYSATGAFLTRIFPYYPQPILSTFSSMVLQSTIDIKSSALIASSFAYLSQHISPQNIQNFRNSTPVFHHFSSADPAFSDFLSQIISNVSHLGIDWLKMLLHSFLEKMTATPDRYLIKALSSIIAHSPTELMPETIFSYKDTLPQNLGLFAFLLTNQGNLFDRVDLYPIASASIDALANQSTPIADVDSALQLISIPSSSFKLTVSITSKTTLTIAIDGRERKQTSILRRVVVGRPSFYLLPLPLELMDPLESDGPLVLTEKFRTIGYQIKINGNFYSYEKVKKLFIQFMKRTHDSTRSSIFEGLSLCISTLLKEANSEDFSTTIRNLLFSEVSSWFEAFDVLKIMKAIGPETIKEALGKGAIEEAIRVLTSFCFSPNENLFKEAASILMAFITEEQANSMFSESFDVFEHFERSIILSELIIQKFSSVPSFSSWISKIIEAEDLFLDNPTILSQIFSILSLNKFDMADSAKIHPLIRLSISLAQSYIELFSGEGWSEINSGDVGKPMMIEIFSKQTTDIVTEPLSNLEPQLVKNALKFYFSLPLGFTSEELAVKICDKTMSLFPEETSKFYETNWKTISEANRTAILNQIPDKLKCVGVDDVYSIWCRIASSGRIFADESLKPTINFLKGSAKSYVNSEADSNPRTSAGFIGFLSLIEENEDVTAFLRKCTEEEFKIVAEIVSKENGINLQKPPNSPAVIVRSVSEEEEKTSSKVESLPRVDSDLSDSKSEKSDPSAHKTDEEATANANKDVNTKDESQEAAKEKTNGADTEQKPELPSEPLPDVKPIEKDNPQFLFNEAIYSGLDSSVISVISQFKTYQFSIEGLAIPPKLIPVLADKLPPSIFTFEESLVKLRTAWRPLCITRINQSPSDFLAFIQSRQKLTKNQILSLTSIVGTVQFDVNTLLQLSYSLVTSASSTRRLYSALILFTTVVAMVQKLSAQYFVQFVTILESKLQWLPPIPLTLSLLTLARKAGPTLPVIVLIRKVFQICGTKSVSVANIHQILVGVSSNVHFVGRDYPFELTAIAIPYVTSALPSLYCAGMRILIQAIFSLNDEKAEPLLRECIPHIINRLPALSKNYPVVDQTVKLLIALQQRPKFTQIQYMVQRSALYDFAFPGAAMNIVAKIYAGIMKNLSVDSERRAMTLCAQMFGGCNFESFSTAVRTVDENIKKAKGDKSSNIAEAASEWLKSGPCRYWTQKGISVWVDLMEKYLTPSQTMSIVCFQFLRQIPMFLPVFVSIRRLAKKYKGNKEVSEILESAIGIAGEKHKIALELAKEEQLTKDQIDSIING